MKHRISLDWPDRVLVVDQPGDRTVDPALWLFNLENRGRGILDLYEVANDYFFLPESVIGNWKNQLSYRLKTPLYGLVESAFLDTIWDQKIFPRVAKIIEDYNSSPVDAE